MDKVLRGRLAEANRIISELRHGRNRGNNG